MKKILIVLLLLVTNLYAINPTSFLSKKQLEENIIRNKLCIVVVKLIAMVRYWDKYKTYPEDEKMEIVLPDNANILRKTIWTKSTFKLFHKLLLLGRIGSDRGFTLDGLPIQVLTKNGIFKIMHNKTSIQIPINFITDYEIFKNMKEIVGIEVLGDGPNGFTTLLIYTRRKRYVLKYLGNNYIAVKYCIKVNQKMTIYTKIHKILPTNRKDFFFCAGLNNFYTIFEYFDDFKTTQNPDYYKLGILAANINNICFKIFMPPKHQDRAKILEKKGIDFPEKEKYNKIKKYFRRGHIHNNLNYKNVDMKMRIIGVRSMRYDHRINEFINILLGDVNMKFKTVNAVRAVLGYQACALKPLNCFEVLGIGLILKTKALEDGYPINLGGLKQQLIAA